ncbi:MAG: MMPL family transporter, partial [Phycisphaerae bacterium]
MTPGHDQPGVWGSVLHRLTTRRAATVLAVAGVIAALCIAMTTRLRPVASLEAMVAADDPAARALQRITRHFSGTEELIVLASWPGESDQGLDAPAAEPSDALLAFARRLVERIESSPELTALCRDVRYRPAAGIRTFIESVVLPNALFYLDDDAMAALQEHLSPEAMRDRFRRAEEMLSAPMAAGPAAQAARRDPLGLRAILRSALPRPAPSHGGAAALDRPFLSADGRHLMIRVRGRRPASDLAFAGALTQAVKAAADQVNRDGLALSYTGAYAIAAAARRAVRADMIRSIVLSIIFLQVLYCIVYRNVWLLPAALAPVALGILAGFAVYAALGLSLTPITAVIGAILAGLGIDYCIHSLCHYRLDRATGLTHEDAARHAMIDVTPAMTAACVTTVIGFLALSRSSVQALREFGLLGAMGIAASLIAAVVVLPAILTVTVGRRGRAGRLDNNVRRSWPARLLGHAVRHHRLFLWIGAAAAATAAVAIVQSRADASFFDHDSRVLHPRPNEPLDTRERIAEWFNLPGDPLVVHLQAGTPEGLIALA